MSYKVLLVDDEKDMLEVLSERMALRGVEATTATSGEEALQLLASRSFDVVVLDLMLPGIDGLTALQRIKELRPELEVVLLTGHGSVKTGVEAMRLGAMDFITKPADLKMLMDRVKEAGDGRLLLAEKREQEKLWELLGTREW